MALAIYFAPTGTLNAQNYDQCIAALKKAGAGHPPGRVYHSAFGTGNDMQVFDVWTSQEAFDAFGPTLMPILEQCGIQPGVPVVMPLHSVIVPPAPKPKAAAKKAAPAKKKSATKKSKKDKKKKKKKSNKK